MKWRGQYDIQKSEIFKIWKKFHFSSFTHTGVFVNGNTKIIVKKTKAWKGAEKDKMGAVLGFIKGNGKRKEGSSFQIHKHKKKLEKA